MNLVDPDSTNIFTRFESMPLNDLVKRELMDVKSRGEVLKEKDAFNLFDGSPSTSFRAVCKSWNVQIELIGYNSKATEKS